MDFVAQSGLRFVISSAEIERRKAAFDRLAVSTTLAATVFAADSIVAYFPPSILGVLALALVFLVSRAALASSFDRFTRTTWTISDTSLTRADERSRDEYPLERVRRVRTMRTAAGGIREIRLGLDGGRSVYVNGIEDFETFREALLSGSPQAGGGGELHEAVDFDHPLFYIVLGIVFGLSLALVVRVARFASGLDARYVYAALAVYLLAMGAYWLRAKPVSGRYGERSAVSDYVIGFCVICLGAGAALAALLQ